jgi:hypothetical protein
MSSTPVDDDVRRVRHQARDAVALMTFSALVSVTAAVAVVLITHLGH